MREANLSASPGIDQGPPISSVQRLLSEKPNGRARQLCADVLADFFATVYGSLVTPAAVSHLLSLDPEQSAAAHAAYRACLEARGIARATVHRRLAVVRRLVTLNDKAPPDCSTEGSDLRHSTAGRSGLTLLELLVVTGVLSLLAALLLPFASAVRDRAWSATCTSHLKQLALAFRLYGEDYEDTFPANNRGQLTSLADLGGLWIGQIRLYLRSEAVFHCPADPIRNARRTFSDALPEEWDRSGLPALSYGANWDLLVAAAEGRPEARVDALPYPAQTLMVADCSEPWAHGPIYTQQGVRWSHIAYANGPPVNGLVNWVYHGGREGSGHERHGTGSHVAFLDGHVAFLPAARFYSATRFEAIGPVEIQRPIIWPKAVPPEE